MAKVSKRLKEQKHDGTTTRRITIKGEPFEQVGWNIRPSYGEDGPFVVEFFRCGELFQELTQCQHGDCVDLIYRKKDDKFSVRKISLPTEDWELVLWFFDLPKKYRANTPEQYKTIRETRILQLMGNEKEPPVWQKEYTIAGGKLAFAQKHEDSDPICLTGRIMPEFAEEAMREIICTRELRRLLAYDNEVVRNICSYRFGLNQGDYNEAKF